MSPNRYPMILNDRWRIGVTKSRITIPISSSELPTIEGERKNWPNTKAEAAKGRVSSKGALELTVPSLLRPILRLTNEPTESPTMHPIPSTQPIVNAVDDPPPK